MAFEIKHGDCLEVLRGMEANIVDAVVTDPPYGLAFMGKKWDYDVPTTDLWAECLRVLKPGGHLLAFAGTRTQHRMCVRIEDAGFEIRDMIAWVYSTGFPKSHNLKGDWQGWGTALKPALEPITVARKPLVGTVAANVLEHGTGALNIDGCRVGWPDGKVPEIGTPAWGGPAKKLTAVPGQDGETVERAEPNQAGRWPANLIHDGSEEVVGLFPKSSCGVRKISPTEDRSIKNQVYGRGYIRQEGGYSDTGSAARFFYVAKASKADRDEGCERNHHPTVKPTALMRYLCRLVTPPGGTVLDPFTGSGSTGKAAKLEGFSFIGIEREAEYVAIAEARIAEAQRQLGLFA